MQMTERKTLVHNIVFNLLDGSFFGFGMGFASFTTIIPLFVAQMTSSALLIGLIPAIHNVGWQFPQLLTANRVNRMERTKPYVMFMTINERLPLFFIGLIALSLPRLGDYWGLILTFACLVWQGLGAGMTANAWQIMISKIIPADMLATFIGAQSSAANLLCSLSAVLAGLILEKVAAPQNYALCFFATVVCYTLSWIFLKQTRESARTLVSLQQRQPNVWHSMKQILVKEPGFTSFLAGRFLSVFGMMAFAFYTVYAVRVIGMDTLTIGIMTSILLITQTVANPVLGRLADKWSRKWVLVLGSICTAASALLSALITQSGWFAVVFILCGIGNTAFWTIGMTFALDYGDENDRPVYVGMSNTLIAPATILAPLLGGLLADSFSYITTFYVSAIFAVLTVVLMTIFVKDPRKKSIPAT